MANTIKIDTQLLEQLSSQLAQVKNSLTSINGSLSGSLSEVRRVAPTQTPIINKLVKTQKNMGTTVDHADKLAKAVGNAASLWASAEKKISAMELPEVADTPYGKKTWEAPATNEFLADKDWFKNLMKIVGSLGAGGAAVGGIGNIIAMIDKGMNGELTGKDWASLAKNMVSALKGTVGKAVELSGKSSDVFWKGMLGLNAVDKKTFTQALADKAGEFVGKSGSTTAAKAAKTTFAWLGAIATFGVNAYSNLTDNSMSKGRAWAETITETAVDVGKGLLIGAAVAAVAPVGAPAVAVAAATAAAGIAVDWVFEKVTGQKLTETVSDFILDTGTAVYEKAKEAAVGLYNTGKAVYETGKAVYETGKTIVKGAAKVMSGLSSMVGGLKSLAMGLV